MKPHEFQGAKSAKSAESTQSGELNTHNALFARSPRSYVDVARRYLSPEKSEPREEKQTEAARLLQPYQELIASANRNALPVLTEPIDIEGQPMRNVNGIVKAYVAGIECALQDRPPNHAAAQRYLRVLALCKEQEELKSEYRLPGLEG